MSWISSRDLGCLKFSLALFSLLGDMRLSWPSL
ncbi:rCG63201 [Rattus norvegicus]|uniref:RCG63201 n=1 Tax=Rattus norvegicus TaxID=10116 RepID=A6IBG4_RAT|nr:rCG63201 [Rattus norvegicus]